jgi:hypothetical protein
MDYINKRRYKIIRQKTVMIRGTNLATAGGIVGTETGTGQVSTKSDELHQTPGSKIVGVNILGTVFGPGEKITYVDEDGELDNSRLCNLPSK